MTKFVKTQHGIIQTPAFMPDATYGAVKTLSFEDVKDCGISELVTNTLHLFINPTSIYIQKFGGVHKFFNWNRPIFTDSGGFQVYTWIHRAKYGKISSNGANFKSPKDGKKYNITPGKSQQIQHQLGSDIRIVLDDCVHAEENLNVNRKSVELTTIWAKKAKDEFLKLNKLDEKQFLNPEKYPRPLLFAVIQGANDNKLRKQSSEELIEIGFDGYNFGGFPIDNKGNLTEDIMQYTADLMPQDKPKYAMGLGTPDQIAKGVEMGYDLFDCVLPTRNARHGLLYVHKGEGDEQKQTCDIIRIKNSQYKDDKKPLDSKCKCEACQNYSRAYLRHLLLTKESAGYRLLTMHNLTFYGEFMKRLRQKS